jgi:hypothetical protein
MKTKLDYTWRKLSIRDSRILNIYDHKEKQELFSNISDRFLKLGYKLVYIDECSISPTTLSNYTWQKKGDNSPLIRTT